MSINFHAFSGFLVPKRERQAKLLLLICRVCEGEGWMNLWVKRDQTLGFCRFHCRSAKLMVDKLSTWL